MAIVFLSYFVQVTKQRKIADKLHRLQKKSFADYVFEQDFNIQNR